MILQKKCYHIQLIHVTVAIMGKHVIKSLKNLWAFMKMNITLGALYVMFILNIAISWSLNKILLELLLERTAIREYQM